MNPNIYEEVNMNHLFASCALIENEMYFISETENVFQKIDVNTGIVEYLNNPKGYLPLTWEISDLMLAYQKCIYIFELNGNKILEYSIEKNTCRYFNINCNKFEGGNYAAVAAYKDKIYIIPSFVNTLIIIDLETETLIKKENVFHTGERLLGTDNLTCRVFTYGFQEGNHLWLFTEMERVVIDYDLEIGDYRIYRFPEMINKCVHAVYKDEKFYILDMNGGVYIWDILNDRTYEIKKGESEDRTLYYKRLIVTKSQIWILPCCGKEITIISMGDWKNTYYSNYPKDFCYIGTENMGKYYGYCENSKFYYFAMHSGNYILSIEKESGKEKWLKPIRILEKRAIYNRNNHWKSVCELKELLWEISKLKEITTNNKAIGLITGKKIWEEVEEDR